MKEHEYKEFVITNDLRKRISATGNEIVNGSIDKWITGIKDKLTNLSPDKVSPPSIRGFFKQIFAGKSNILGGFGDSRLLKLIKNNPLAASKLAARVGDLKDDIMPMYLRMFLGTGSLPGLEILGFKQK